MQKILLAVAAVVCASVLSAQSVTLTNIPALDSQGHVVKGGSLFVSWRSFIADDGTLIQGGSKTVTIQNGVFTITLTASDNAGWPYNALIMGGVEPTVYLWKIPASGGVTSISQISKLVPNATSTVTLTGASDTVASVLGATVSGDCAGTWDAHGNLIPSSAPCANGAGGVLAGATGQFAVYPSNGTTVSGHSLTVGDIPALDYQAPLGFTPLNKANNLSDLTSVAAARTSLGLSASATTDTTNASNISTGTLGAARLPSDQCILTKYTIAYNDSSLAGVSSASPTKTLFSLPSTSTRICLIEIAGSTSFTGISNLTAATVRLQSAAATPLLYSPNQDIFGAVGSSTNNYWTDAGNTADRTNQSVVAAFAFTCSSGSCYGSGLSDGSVSITVGTRTMP